MLRLNSMWGGSLALAALAIGCAFASGVRAEEPAADPAHPEVGVHVADSHAEDSHGGAHHDPHDLSHGNAGPKLESPEEWKADLSIYTFVVFLLLLLVLWKFAWGPIVKGLDAREQGIQNEIASAKRDAEASAAKLAEYEAKLADAQREVKELLDQARRDGEVQRVSIVADAQKAAAAEKTRAVNEIQLARDAALSDLANASVNTAMALTSKILRREFNAGDHAQLVGDAERELSKTPSRN